MVMARIKGTIKKASGLYYDEISRCKIEKCHCGWKVREAGAHPMVPEVGIGKTLTEAVKIARGE